MARRPTMCPVLFKLGPFSLHTYGALVAAGFLLGTFLAAALANRHGVEKPLMFDLAWVLLLSGIAGARVLYVLFNMDYFWDRPLDVLRLWEGGLVWYGGVMGALAASVVWARRRNLSWWTLADLTVPGAALGHAVGRLGCFAAGCCYGRPSEAPWAVVFNHPDTLAPMGIPLHPTQLYEAGLDGLIFFGLFILARRRPTWIGTGRIVLLYVFLYGAARLFVEFWRGDSRGPVMAGLTSTQAIALVSMAAAVILSLWRRGTRAGR